MRRRAALALLGGGAMGCATAENYLDPDGPRYAGTSGVTFAGRPHVLKVVSWNIAYARQIEGAIEQLRGHADLRGADIVLLQEMDAAGSQAIAGALGLNWVYYPSSVTPKTRRDFGNAVLTRFPIEADGKLLLPHLGRVLRRSRAATWARLRVGDEAWRVYSLHLGSPLGLSGGKRGEQAETVGRHAARSADPAVIVGGDFNSHGAAGRVAALDFHWPTRTIGGTTGSFPLDHVLLRGFRYAHSGIARGIRGVSDHRPVWTLIAR
jgi:endonuclease/exonuclease/phosphatase family metal-dependent hydrolase